MCPLQQRAVVVRGCNGGLHVLTVLCSDMTVWGGQCVFWVYAAGCDVCFTPRGPSPLFFLWPVSHCPHLRGGPLCPVALAAECVLVGFVEAAIASLLFSPASSHNDPPGMCFFLWKPFVVCNFHPVCVLTDSSSSKGLTRPSGSLHLQGR